MTPAVCLPINISGAANVLTSFLCSRDFVFAAPVRGDKPAEIELNKQ